MNTTRFKQRIVHDGSDIIEPGDVVSEHGPRIGWRYWQVIDTVERRVWRVVTARALATGGEAEQAIIDAHRDGNTWHVER